MKLINIGFGGLVSSDKLICVLSPESAPIKRVISEAKEKGCLIDASFGRKTKAVIFTDTEYIILSSLTPEKIMLRMEDNDEQG